MYRNNGEPHLPIIPRDDQILGGIMPPTETVQEHGLHSRADILIDLSEIEGQLLGANPKVTLRDYQYWAEGNWKTQHGTYASVERFGEKLREEHAEVVEAYQLFASEPAVSAQRAALANNFISE